MTITQIGVSCPLCKKPLEIEIKVAHNTDAYSESAIARAKCCGGLVHVQPLRRYSVLAYAGSNKLDDWGE